MSNNKLTISLIQMRGKKTPQLNANLIKKYLIQSLKYKPDIIFTPECSNIITGDKRYLLKFATTQENCPVLNECIQFAKSNNKFISIGSLLLKTKNSNKLINRSFFINNLGKIKCYYDKIHLFDVKINKKETHRESKTFNKGKKLSFITTPWGKFGLTICYDIRFPLLYRKLIKLGCKFIIIPAAFTVPTGKDHWEILMRSRAIENTCFIIGAAQCGNHHGSRKTYGHSLVVDPWGRILAKGSRNPEILSVALDLSIINSTRLQIPSIYHD